MADAAGGESGERVLRCQNCGRLTGTHFSALHDCASSVDSPHDFRELEVVPLSRAEAAETALREADKALSDTVRFHHAHVAGHTPGPFDYCRHPACQALRQAHKRARTTSTEGKRDE